MKIIKEKVMGKYDITVDEAVKLLDSRTNYNQGFILCVIRWKELIY